MLCATCRLTLPEDAATCGGCGTPTSWDDARPRVARGRARDAASAPTHVRERTQPAFSQYDATIPSRPPPASLPDPAVVDAVPPASLPESAGPDAVPPSPTPDPAVPDAVSPEPSVPEPAPSAAVPAASGSRWFLLAAVLLVGAVAAAMILLRREPTPPPLPEPVASAPELSGLAEPAAAESAPVSAPAVVFTPPPPTPLADGWLGLVEQSSGHALVLEPLMRHAAGAWRRDWPEPVPDEGLATATSLVTRVRDDWFLRRDALPQQWRAWDSGGIESAVIVSGTTTVRLGCMRGAGLRTDLPLPRDLAAFREDGEGEMMLVDPLVVVSGLARPVPAELVAPGSPLEVLARSVLADLDELEAAGVERWSVEAGTQDGRVKGTVIALDAAIRALSGPWIPTVQAACSPVAGAVPLFFTATRTHPDTRPGNAVACPSIVSVSGWALVRDDTIERLDGTLQVQHRDCAQPPSSRRVLAFLEDGERRLAVEIERARSRVDVVLVDIDAGGVERIVVVPHGGC